ncbi:MAG: dTMP kinase [Actinomycetota bacterium]|nr:dTMP kinase [Actinomycetota bacterium]
MGATGRLVALEGIDGCGKTTQARLLAEAVGVEPTAEPGATPVGGALRRVLLDPALPELVPRTEALLMAADRAEHVARVIAPALQAGAWVVTDRYSGSTLAYQGHGRGLGLDDLSWLVAWATGGIQADLSVLVAVDVDTALARAAARVATVDRMERLGVDFQRRVAAGFAALAAADPERWVAVDGTGTVPEVAAAVRAAVADRLGDPPGGWR